MPCLINIGIFIPYLSLMNRSGALYRLIRSMSQNEKRYFTHLATANRDSSDYVRMFKVIDEQKITDDEKLKGRLTGKAEVRHFAVKKIQLYQLLLKSLRNFHEGRSFDFTLKEMMIDAAILSDKALYHDCHSILIKAKAIAGEYEEWKVLLEILHKEYTIIQHVFEAGELEKEILRFHREEKVIIAQLNNYSELTYLNMSLRIIIQESKHGSGLSVSRGLKKLSIHDLLQHERKAISFRAKSLYFLIRSTIFISDLEYEKAERMLKNHHNLYEKHPHFIAASPGNYLNVLNELMLVHFRMHRFEEALKYIQRLRQLPETSHIRKIRSSRFRMLMLAWTLRIELSIALSTGNVPAILDQLQEQEEYFVRHALLFEPTIRIETFLALASCYYDLQDNSKAIFYLQKIFQDHELKRGGEILFMANVLQFIIHFEEGNGDLLDHLARALKRSAAKNKYQLRSEKLLCELATRLLRINMEKKYRVIYSSYLKKFEALKQVSKEQSLYDYFDVTRWLKARLQ
ncbi:MAG: hypothetical protein ABIO23_02830 [Chitinophagales bacterium]